MYIVKCSAFQSRNSSDLENLLSVFQAFLLITIGNICVESIGPLTAFAHERCVPGQQVISRFDKTKQRARSKVDTRLVARG